MVEPAAGSWQMPISGGGIARGGDQANDDVSDKGERKEEKQWYTAGTSSSDGSSDEEQTKRSWRKWEKDWGKRKRRGQEESYACW